jgi:hypothetical protein
MKSKEQHKKIFTVHWAEYHRGTISAKNLKEAERLINTNGVEIAKTHPKHIEVDNIYVEE